jgi:hypothetical protein
VIFTIIQAGLSVILASGCAREPLSHTNDLVVGIEPFLATATKAIEVVHRISRAFATDPADGWGSLEEDSKTVANQHVPQATLNEELGPCRSNCKEGAFAWTGVVDDSLRILSRKPLEHPLEVRCMDCSGKLVL